MHLNILTEEGADTENCRIKYCLVAATQVLYLSWTGVIIRDATYYADSSYLLPFFQ
jgi:hypothetical protein